MAIFVFMAAGALGSTYDAGADLKVYDPYVEKGEWELELKGRVDFDNNDDKGGAQQHKYGLGYGVTDRWFTEVYGEVEKERNEDTGKFVSQFTATEWENKVQLTEMGKYPVDLGFLLEYEISAQDKHPNKLEWRALFDKTIGRAEHVANFIFEHEVGGGHRDETEGGFAWSSRYLVERFFEPGFEYHADFGGFNEEKSFQEQTHLVGPVFYGKYRGFLKYNVGYLFGVSEAAPQGALKWTLEFEHDF